VYKRRTVVRKTLPNRAPIQAPIQAPIRAPIQAPLTVRIPILPVIPNINLFRTLADINTYIENTYTLLPKENIQDDTYMKRFENFQFRSINTSGNNSDCLIHSFLDATCPAFRRLLQFSKE
jgi:hypothetical protein